MIIDIHVHYPFGKTGAFSENKWDVNDLIASAKKIDISHICLLGDVLRYSYYPTEEQIKETNDFTINAIRQYPGYFSGFCFLNPDNAPDFIVSEIERCIRVEKFKGIKLEVSVNCRSPKLDIIMEKAKELNCPVLHHTWYKSTAKTDCESEPSDIVYLAKRHPDVKIIMAHLSGCGFRGVLDIKPFKNVYVDTSGSQPVAGMLEYAIEKLGASRILYGSDVPCRDFYCQMGRIMGANISPADKENILFKNAAELLNLRSI